MDAQIIEQYWRYGSIKELYNVQRVLERKNCHDLIIIPVDLAIFAFIWAYHERFWWMITPKNFVCSTLLILFLSMLIERPSRFIFFLAGWNKINLVLSGCKVSLLALNQVATKESSWFTILVSSEIFLCWKKILVSSAKRMNER